MRDRRFVAAHRGGPLKKERHYQLIKWASDCAGHVLNLSGETIDARLISALKVAEEWRKGKTSVGAARKASLGAIAAANGSANLIAIAAARSIGHAVATAHMADHSLAAADYALKAVKNAGQSPAAERKWQDEKLPPEVRGLVLSARKSRKI